MVRLPQGLGTTVRIAFVHSFYRSENPSGENAIVDAEVMALRRAGHAVELVSASTDEMLGESLYRARTALRVATGRGRDPLAAIREFDADVVHVHNLFPNWARRWVEELNVPLVVTLHNYRPMCAAGTLFRDGRVCALCPNGTSWSGVRYACYQESRLATLPVAWTTRNGGRHNLLLRRAARIILAPPAVPKYEDIVDRSKMVPWPNFLPDTLDPGFHGGGDREGFLFVGRLSEEKGIRRLIERWPRGQRLIVVGDGEQRLEIERLTDRPDIDFLGLVPRERVLELMGEATALIVPSLWFEMSPRVYPEALAVGLPVVAFEPNHVASFVIGDGTGLTASWDDPLGEVLEMASTSLAGLHAHARAVFDSKYSEVAHVARAERLYGELIGSQAS